MRSVERVLWLSIVIASIGMSLAACVLTKGVDAVGYVPVRLVEALRRIELVQRVEVTELYPLVAQRVEYMAEYGCATFTSNFFVTGTLCCEHFSLIPDAVLRLSYYGMGTVEAGFDLQDFEVGILAVDGPDGATSIQIVVDLGQPRVLSTDIDHEMLRYEVESSWTGSRFGREGVLCLNRTLLSDARNDLIIRAINVGILDRARANMTRDIEDLVAALGYDAEVVVNIRRPAQAPETRIQEDGSHVTGDSVDLFGLEYSWELE